MLTFVFIMLVPVLSATAFASDGASFTISPSGSAAYGGSACAIPGYFVLGGYLSMVIQAFFSHLKTKCRFFPLLLAAIAVFLTGCHMDEDVNELLETSPSAETEIMLPDLLFSVSNEMILTAANTLTQISSLPELTGVSLKIDIDELYCILSGESNVDDLTYEGGEYPDGSGTYSHLTKGGLPWYDIDLALNSYKDHTDLHYQISQFSCINAVFYYDEDESYLSDASLNFMNFEDVTKMISDVLAQYDVVLGNMNCHSLTSTALQELHDIRSANGSLRENRWGISDGSAESQIKSHSDIADKEIWSECDACYFLTAYQYINNIPVYGEPIIAYVGEDGILYLSAPTLVSVSLEGEPEALLDISMLLSKLDNITDSLYYENEISLTELNLYYYPSIDGTYRPTWQAIFTYDFMNPDGFLEQGEAEVLIDAGTGIEIPHEVEPE